MPRDLTMDLPRVAQASTVASVDEEARTIEVVFSTGARIPHMMRTPEGWRRVMTQAVVEPGAAMLDKLNDGAPVLNDHDDWSNREVIGVVEQAWIEGGVAKARLRFSAADGVRDVWTKVREGVLRNCSMGFYIHEAEVDVDPERDGEELWRLTKWEPVEISMVPIGADAGAKTQSVGDAPICTATITYRAEEGDMPVKDKAPDEAQQKVEQAEGGKVEKQAAPTPPAGPDPEAERAQQRRGVEAERTRQAAIRGTAARVAERMPHAREAVEAAMQQALEGDTTPEAFRVEALEAAVSQGQAATGGFGGANASVTSDARERLVQGATVGLMARAGMKGGERNEFTGMTLRELARQSLALSGRREGWADPRDMVAAAFTQAGGPHSTSDFAAILADVAHKSALMGWDSAVETYEQWTRAGSLTDFRATKRVGTGLFSTLPEVPEGGEYTHGTIGDRGETATLATYGRLFRITRQAIINDDLSLLADVPRKMGQAAKRTIGNLVYAVLSGNPTMADGTALFHADHKNLAGSGTAMSTTTLAAGEAAMMVQTEGAGAVSDANPALNIRPAYLLVPPGKKRAALQLMNSTVDPSDSKGHASNPVAGLAEVIADGRLTGNAWFMAADPNVYDTIEVAYLNGASEPWLEEKETWTSDGAEMKVRIDAAVTPLDHRTFYKNPGA